MKWSDNRIGARSDHEVQMLDDPGGNVLVAAEFDVLGACGAHRPAAGEPGELQCVEPDRRRRFLLAEVARPPRPDRRR